MLEIAILTVVLLIGLWGARVMEIQEEMDGFDHIWDVEEDER